MKKVLSIIAIVALASCGQGKQTETKNEGVTTLGGDSTKIDSIKVDSVTTKTVKGIK